MEALLSIAYTYAFLNAVYIHKEQTMSYASTSACRLYHTPCENVECIEFEYCRVPGPDDRRKVREKLMFERIQSLESRRTLDATFVQGLMLGSIGACNFIIAD